MNGGWKILEKKSMPAVDNHRSFLLCRGAFDPDDQLMSTAKRVQYDGKDPYIWYMRGAEGWAVLPEDQYRDCLWKEIEYPVCG